MWLTDRMLLCTLCISTVSETTLTQTFPAFEAEGLAWSFQQRNRFNPNVKSTQSLRSHDQLINLRFMLLNFITPNAIHALCCLQQVFVIRCQRSHFLPRHQQNNSGRRETHSGGQANEYSRIQRHPT